MPTANDAGRPEKPFVLRRRPSPEQGKGLEILGHAIDYLLDSYGMTIPRTAEMEAAQLLMDKSIEIFKECPEIVPLGRRLRQGITGLGRQVLSRFRSRSV